MKEKIFAEMQRLDMGKGHVWRFQQYNTFANNLNPIEREEFHPYMNKLCEAGIFTKEGLGTDLMYRLTEKGVDEIYRK